MSAPTTQDTFRPTQIDRSDTQRYREAMEYVEELMFKFQLLNDANFIMMPTARLLRWRESPQVMEGTTPKHRKFKRDLEAAIAEKHLSLRQRRKLQ